MQIIREILPNGKPIIVDALIDDDGEVMPDTVRVFPVGFLTGELIAMEESTILSSPRLASRLAKYITTNEIT